MRVEDGQGHEFRKVRELAGVTIRQVAAETGIHHSTLSRWERGERDLADATYDRAVSALTGIINARKGAA